MLPPLNVYRSLRLQCKHSNYSFIFSTHLPVFQQTGNFKYTIWSTWIWLHLHLKSFWANDGSCMCNMWGSAYHIVKKNGFDWTWINHWISLILYLTIHRKIGMPKEKVHKRYTHWIKCSLGKDINHWAIWLWSIPFVLTYFTTWVPPSLVTVCLSFLFTNFTRLLFGLVGCP